LDKATACQVQKLPEIQNERMRLEREVTKMGYKIENLVSFIM